MSRFHEPQHPDFQRLNASLGFDRRLWPQDVAQSRAHARMLAARRDHRRAGPRRAARRPRRGRRASSSEARFAFRADDEDIHMAIERRLTEIAGPVGGRLHTARSRNDQVVDRPRDVHARARAEARRRARRR